VAFGLDSAGRLECLPEEVVLPREQLGVPLVADLAEELRRVFDVAEDEGGRPGGRRGGRLS